MTKSTEGSPMVFLPMISFLVCSFFASIQAIHYSQQIIAIVDNDPSVEKAAKYLYEKNPLVSQVVRRNPKTKVFARMKWNHVTNAFVEHTTTTGGVTKPVAIEPLPHGGRIQVVGHGRYDSTKTKITMGGMDAKEMAGSLLKLPNDGKAGAIKRVSLVGCSVGELNQAGTGFVGSDFPSTLLTEMKARVDQVSSRTGIVGVDSTGRKVYGEKIADKIVWRPKESTITKTVIELDKLGNVKIIDKTIGHETEKYSPPTVVDKNFKTDGGEIKLEEIVPTGGAPKAVHITLDNEEIFQILSEVTHDYFAGITVPKNWDTTIEQRKLVKVFDDRNAKPPTFKEEAINVRELKNFNNFITEVKRWGDVGFEYPYKDPTTKAFVTTNSAGQPWEDKWVYHRYGDFVYSLKVQSKMQIGKGQPVLGLDPFYTKFVGVVVNEDVTNPPAGRKNGFVDLKGFKFGSAHYHVQPHTDENFMSNTRKWLTGSNDEMGTSRTDAINGEVTIATQMCESLRDFRTIVTNAVSLDLNAHVETFDRNAYYKGHPIARGSAGPARHSGLRPDFYETKTGRAKKTAKVKGVKNLMGSVMQQWVEAGYKDTTAKTRKRPLTSTTAETTDATKRARIINDFKDSIKKVISGNKLEGSAYIEDSRTIEGPLFEGPYDTRDIMKPQTESVENEVLEYQGAEDLSLPLRASQAMLRDQMYISQEIAKDVEARQVATGREYQVDENTISVEENEVKYKIYDPSEPSSRQEVVTELDESKLTTNEVMNEMHDRAQTLQTEPESVSGGIGRGLAIYGTVMGIKGTIELYRKGEYGKATVSLAQTLHGLGDLTQINPKIYKVAAKVLGKIATKAVTRVSEVVGEVVGESVGKLVASAGGKLLSSVGEATEFLSDIPIIGTAFGIYNIYEDLQRGTTIGYIDAGLDTLITVLGLLGPEAEPFVIALTIVRFFIDEFYTDIKKELAALPPDASTGAKVIAVLKGIGKAIVATSSGPVGDIIAALKRSDALEKQHKQDQVFLTSLADYHNYYTVTACNGATKINFAGDSESWNGGDIHFVLDDDGLGGDLTMKGTDVQGVERTHNEHLGPFDREVEDIIMGIGESHSVKFKTDAQKMLVAASADEMKMIDGLTGDQKSLHGEYIGNNRNNNFFAIQKLPSKIEYGFGSYHYRLFGKGGNDNFFLGPQHSYVEGNAGADTYFLESDSTHVTLNNEDSYGTEDFMIIQNNIKSITVSWFGNDVVLSYGSKFKVTILNWYLGKKFQHLSIRTTVDDGLSHIEQRSGQPTLIAYARSAANSNNSVYWNSAYDGFPDVIQLIGSDHNDWLFGNDNDNFIMPGKGEDYMWAGEGMDTYNIEHLETGRDSILNHATDGKLDTVIYPAMASKISVRKDYYHLNLEVGDYQLVVQYWFYPWDSESYRHITIYTQDRIFLEIRQDKEDKNIAHLIPAMKELSDHEPNIDLEANNMFKQITSVIGTTGSNRIYGNSLKNYITGGGGFDVLSGREGADTYVVRQIETSGDPSFTPSGSVRIVNFAYDLIDDVLYYYVNFDDIVLHAAPVGSDDLRCTVASNPELEVILVDWFKGDEHQHLLIRSIDGISFRFPTDRANLENKILIVDNTNADSGRHVDLTETRYANVQRVTGSRHREDIAGNNLDNNIDPLEGGGTLRGRDGSDTYVLNPGYGEVIINNAAGDNIADTIRLGVNYDDFTLSKDSRSVTIQYSDTTNSSLSFSCKILNYKTEANVRHLTVVTKDGVSFVIPPEKDYNPVIIAINHGFQSELQSGYQVNLGFREDYEEVRAVYGAKLHRNAITGNDKFNTIVGGDEDDDLIGGDGNDVLKGGEGDNELVGEEGNDTLNGGSGNDVLNGGQGNDLLSPGEGDNFIDGGDGDDTVVYMGDPTDNEGIYIDLNNEWCQHGYGRDIVENVENVFGTPYDDYMISSSMNDNTLNGQEGDDTFIALDGYDILIGGKGADTYNLVEASGTKVIDNNADDGVVDTIDLSYVNANKLRYEKNGNDLIFRVVSSIYTHPDAYTFPGCILKMWHWVILRKAGTNLPTCEAYSMRKPTVILRDYFVGGNHQHIVIVTADCTLETNYLQAMPPYTYCLTYSYKAGVSI